MSSIPTASLSGEAWGVAARHSETNLATHLRVRLPVRRLNLLICRHF
jgi:hypothetical protein